MQSLLLNILFLQSAVSVLGLVQEILPHVAALNNLSLVTQNTAITETLESCHTTTSTHYAWVESDHPYKPASVYNYKYNYFFFIKKILSEFFFRNYIFNENCFKIYLL